MSRSLAQAGFTLLELLVALAVTAGIAVLSWQFIDGAIRASTRGGDVLREVDALERFWQAFDMDLQQSRVPVVVSEDVDVAAATGLQPAALEFAGGDDLSGRPLALPVNGTARPWLFLLRESGEHPGQPMRVGLQRVLYSLEEGRLLRQSWPERHLQAAPEQTVVRELANGIDTIRVRFLAPSARDWSDTWPPLDTALPESSTPDTGPLASLPLAISLTLHTEALGDVERLFVLPGS